MLWKYTQAPPVAAVQIFHMYTPTSLVSGIWTYKFYMLWFLCCHFNLLHFGLSSCWHLDLQAQWPTVCSPGLPLDLTALLSMRQGKSTHKLRI